MRNRRVRPIDLARQHVDPLQIALVALLYVGEPLRILLIGEELAGAEFRGPLQRNAVFPFARPLALKVEVAPGRALRPLARALRRDVARKPGDSCS